MAQGAAAPQRSRAGFIADLRARLAARPDTEHEQGILRLVISALVVWGRWPRVKAFFGAK